VAAALHEAAVAGVALLVGAAQFLRDMQHNPQLKWVWHSSVNDTCFETDL
jgi:hypothetical protein